jgi:hypothetical protein
MFVLRLTCHYQCATLLCHTTYNYKKPIQFMMIKNIATFCFIFAVFSVAAMPNAWQELAKADLDFIYQHVKANHPGAIDQHNPEFGHWLEQGYQQANSSIADIDDLAAVLNLLRRYIAGFADGHMSLHLTHQAASVRWPGFIVRKQGEQVIVSSIATDWPAALPPVNAQLLHCDGRTAEQLLQQQVLPYTINLPELVAVQYKYTANILSADDSWQGGLLQQCSFAAEPGSQSYSLQWRRTSRQNWQQHKTPQASAAEFKLHTFAPERHWVRLPTFTPSAAQQIQLKAITEQVAALRSAEVVVFDVRGNGGGNSQWGVDLAQALYGKEHFDSVLTPIFSQGKAYWRASADNTAAVANIVEQVTTQFGADAEITLTFSDLAARMAQHSATDLVPQSVTNSTPETESAIKPSLTGARVVLLTDESCGSACLDFADMLLPLGAIHAGLPTFADTVYMDIRYLALPSKLGQFSLPQKVYRNRPRGNNQPYQPDMAWWYHGDMQHNDQLEAWLNQQLDKQ